MEGPGLMTSIYVDADACPVKEEVYRVAGRYGLGVFVVSNSWIRTPASRLIELVVVDQGPDVADDWIAERVGVGDIVVTADLPLAERTLQAGGQAIGPTGRAFTMDNIGTALASRAIGEHLRSTGQMTAGPRPFSPSDRSQFLQSLDKAVVKAQSLGRRS